MLVVSLASSDMYISTTALETVHILMQNKLNHSALCSTYGILEAVKFSSERMIDEDMVQIAKQILHILTGPAYGTRSRKKKQEHSEQDRTSISQTKEIVLYVQGLGSNNLKNLEKLLIHQRGVVSLHVSLEEQTCTLRVLKDVSPRILAKSIFEKLHLEVKLVVRSAIQDRMLLSLHDQEDDSCCDLPPYLPEVDSPVRNKAVTRLGQWKASASGVLDWFQKSFFW
ncbi:armadillo repeat-containing protein 1-like isoform X2 [Periplaneta americana]